MCGGRGRLFFFQAEDGVRGGEEVCGHGDMYEEQELLLLL